MVYKYIHSVNNIFERSVYIMMILDLISFILVLVGAINWGLIGFFEFDLVAALFGSFTTFSRIVYSLIGLAGLYSISFLAKRKYRDNK